MSEDSDEQKEFDASPRRKEQFRKEGKFPRSKDGAGVLALGTCLMAASLSLGDAASVANRAMHRTWGDLGSITRGDAATPFSIAGGVLLLLCAPPALISVSVGLFVGFAQAGIRFDWDLVSFKPERWNPLPKLKELFSFKQPLVEATLAVMRVVAIAYVGFAALRDHGTSLLQLSRLPLRAGIEELSRVSLRVVTPLVVALGVLSCLEYGHSWYRLRKEMRMSRKEMMDENKAEDGDPKVKGRMRQRARALAKKRSLKNVKDATVVVTNPTHVAVALRYGPKDPAPVVVAKGHDAVALQIRAEARRHRIPIVENRRLARAIDATVEIGHPIAADHFAAVAKVLAFVYGLRQGSQREGLR